MLTAILGNLSLARREAAPSGAMLPFLDQAERALTRAAGLTRQLLTFSKGGAPVTCDVDLPQLLQEAADFALGGSKVRCDIRMPAELGLITADPGQLHQVVSNLLINAAQAMPDGGEVTIRADNERVGPDATLEPGTYVKLTVEDRGVGIPAEYRSQIFDPYFTTKPSGSGLGLATAYSIVRRHGGDIVLAPDSGTGTTFHVYLPSSGQPADRPGLGDRPETSDPAAVAASGRILIMDDDPAIRTLVAAIVTRLGYDVDLARDGGEAVASFAEAVDSGAHYSAVILDLTIPGGMGGKETLLRMQEIDPEVRAIVSSGYSEDPILADYRAHGFAGVVVKPYRVSDLTEALHRVARRESAGSEGGVP